MQLLSRLWQPPLIHSGCHLGARARQVEGWVKKVAGSTHWFDPLRPAAHRDSTRARLLALSGSAACPCTSQILNPVRLFSTPELWENLGTHLDGCHNIIRSETDKDSVISWLSARIYIYIYIYIYMYMYTCVYVYTYMYMYIHMYIYIYVYRHICISATASTKGQCGNSRALSFLDCCRELHLWPWGFQGSLAPRALTPEA